MRVMAIKTGLIGIIRIAELVNLNYLLLVLGALTGLGGVFFAMLENRPKRIMAQHTISQVGYILLGIGTGTALGLLAATLHLVYHGLFKSLLFVSVGHADVGKKTVYQETGFPLSLASRTGIIVGSLAIMSIPPLNGYFSKALLLEQAGGGWVWAVMIAISLGTALSFFKLNWGLLIGSVKRKPHKGDLSVLIFSLIVLLSGGITWVTVSGEVITELFSLRHLLVTFGLFLAGGFGLFCLHNRLEKIDCFTFPFDLDNALVSIFTGFLVVVGVMAFV